MREILFRGKTDKGEWVYGVPIKDDFDAAYIVQGLFACDEYRCTGADGFDVDENTVGQYTGLTDKNGKKIFEGDAFIDEGNETVDVVEFRHGKFCLVSYGIRGALMEYGWDENAGGFGECECCGIDDYYVDEIEFTHNIHDNPELLGGE